MLDSQGFDLTINGGASPDDGHQRQRVITLYVVLLAAMLLLFGWLLSDKFKEELDANQVRASSLASVLVAWTEGVLRQSDQAQHTMSQMTYGSLAVLPDAPERQRQLLQSFVDYLPLIDSVSITDANRQIILSNDVRNQGLLIRNTKFFSEIEQGEQQHRVTELYASPRDEAFFLLDGHRLTDAEGKFIGAVLSRLQPSVFEQALQQMDVGAGETVVLFDANMRVIASVPHTLAIGERLESEAVSRWLASGKSSMIETLSSPLEDQERIDYMRRVGDYPLYALVGIEVDDVLAEWRQLALVLTVAALVIALLGGWGVRHYLNRLRLSHQLQQRMKERERARTHALAREARLDALVQSIQDLIFVFDSKGRYTYVHSPDPRKLLLDKKALMGKYYADIFPRNVVEDFDAVFKSVQQFGITKVFEYSVEIDWQKQHYHAVVSPLVDADRQANGVLLVARDVTHERNTQLELNIAAAAFQTHLGILITDARGSILKANETFKRITGYSDAELIGNNPRMLSSGHHSAAFYRRLWRQVLATGNWEGEIWNQRKSGELYPEWLTISAVYDANGALTNYVATISDISERKAAEKEIHQLAFYDSLTGLANRRLFISRMTSVLEEQHERQLCSAVMQLDIDSFKQVNDTMGHFMGDQLLQVVARRIEQALGDSDTLARMGGDEFAILLEGVDGSATLTRRLAEGIANKLLATLKEPIVLGNEQVSVTACIGVAIMEGTEHSVDDYLQHVDMALSQAKGNQRMSLRFFDPIMQAELFSQVKLESDLRQAVIEAQWQLYLQPQVDPHGNANGVETLLRWQHPERGMVSPGEFIPLLESTGLIYEAGEWVLTEACRLLEQWSHSPALSKLTISVNISPLQFRDPAFLRRVNGVFERSGAPLHKLKLEVTESLFVEAPRDVREKMLSLKDKGVRFSMDDFGTGYSSLAYLAQLPLDQLKIDQSFVRQVLESSANAAIVESTIVLAKSLNLDVIAEGVETHAQLEWLLRHECHAFQGYLFGKPMTIAAFERWLLEG